MVGQKRGNNLDALFGGAQQNGSDHSVSINSNRKLKSGSPFVRQEEFTAAAQEIYLFDDIPLKLTRERSGQPSHSIAHYDKDGQFKPEESRGHWTENPSKLEPFEAAKVRDVFVRKFESKLRELRTAIPPVKPDTPEKLKEEFEVDGLMYRVVVLYFSNNEKNDGGVYYEATLFRKEK
ncbi:MAG: hypothetical protein COA47_14400 [Robiginitomaculum sp.]|nr:MAG: hypothetical protein COA47_14400 [Robiginitomaculum sp.]